MKPPGGPRKNRLFFRLRGEDPVRSASGFPTGLSLTNKHKRRRKLPWTGLTLLDDGVDGGDDDPISLWGTAGYLSPSPTANTASWWIEVIDREGWGIVFFRYPITWSIPGH